MSKTNVKNKPKILKTLILSLLLILSYSCSVYINGFKITNSRFVYLIVFTLIGFIVFYIVYYIIYFFTFLKYKNYDKKKKSSVVNCDDKVTKFLNSGKYDFTYDIKLTVNDNFSNAFALAKTVIHDVAKLNGKNNKYFYLNYTVYDALEIYGNLVSFAYGKFDGVFKFFKIQNKPLSFIEKSLEKFLDQENNAKSEKSNGLMVKIKKGIGNAVLNTGIFLFKNKIQDAVNEIMQVITLEAFKVYGKNTKINTQVLEQEIGVQNA